MFGVVRMRRHGVGCLETLIDAIATTVARG